MEKHENSSGEFHFGENLKYIRLSKEISQEAVAYGLGMSQATYSRIERQAALPNYELVRKMAEILKVGFAELVPEAAQFQQEVKVAVINVGKEFARSPVGLIVTIAAVAYLVDVVYQLTREFCLQLGTSPKALVMISCLCAFFTLVFCFRIILKIRD
jgi:transcriptional regulator with XRE-family HTH domain